MDNSPEASAALWHAEARGKRWAPQPWYRPSSQPEPAASAARITRSRTGLMGGVRLSMDSGEMSGIASVDGCMLMQVQLTGLAASAVYSYSYSTRMTTELTARLTASCPAPRTEVGDRQVMTCRFRPTASRPGGATATGTACACKTASLSADSSATTLLQVGTYRQQARPGSQAGLTAQVRAAAMQAVRVRYYSYIWIQATRAYS